MRHRALPAAALCAALGVAACETAPTPYQPATTSEGGYTSLRIEADRYRINFRGNTSTSKTAVESYMLLRAAELTLENGYDSFTVAHRETDKDTTIRSYGGYYGYYGPPYYPYYGWGPYWGAWGGPDYRTRTSYEASMEIIMGRGARGDDPDTFDAREVSQNLAGLIARPVQ
jgi:hypothetical protein